MRNHGGGHYNHSFFWTILAPAGKNGTPLSEVLNFKEEFNKAAISLFGSGWVWLVKDSIGNLKVVTTPLQDSPIAKNLKPILAIDIWEHAYYLKYQNRRPEYIEAFWNIVNWETVKERLR